MRILIVGLGSIGRRHLRNLLTLGEGDIVLCRTQRSTLPDDELARFPVETDIRTALARGAEAVIVATPTALHLASAIPAAEAGCTLLIEKPLSHTFSGVDALRKAAASGGARILLGYQFRFHAGMRQAKAWIEEGAIGRPISARAHYGDYLPDWHPWEDYRRSYSASAELGGGALLTLCHPLDYLRFLFGEAESVWGMLGRNGGLDIQVEDTAEVGLRFRSGVIASIHLDFVQQPPAHWLEIIGQSGTLRWDYQQNTLQVQTKEGGHLAWQGDQDDVRNPMFLEEMRHFLALARGEECSLCTLEDGVRSLEIALSAIKSEQTGQLQVLPPSAV